VSRPANHPDMVDPRQPRLGQAITGLILIVGFVLDLRVVLPVLAVVLGAASLLGPRFNPYAYLFRALLGAGFFGPPLELEESAPPRFANAVGFVVLSAATVAAYTQDSEWVAWGLGLLVAALALLAAITGLCLGCELYVVGRRHVTRGRAPGHILRREVGAPS
jgi:Domain of unknown function (DUF4395)